MHPAWLHLSLALLSSVYCLDSSRLLSKTDVLETQHLSLRREPVLRFHTIYPCSTNTCDDFSTESPTCGLQYLSASDIEVLFRLDGDIEVVIIVEAYFGPGAFRG